MKETLIDVLRHDLEQDPGDAPEVHVDDDVLEQDMRWVEDQAAGRTSVIYSTNHGV